MTLTSETNRVQYAGDGAQIAFPITFVYWLDADIKAVHTDTGGTETIWVLGTHYTLAGGSGSTGTLTVKTSPTDYTPASGETLTITSNLGDTQDTSLPEGGSFPSSSVEQQLDKIVRLIQQKAEALGRAIKLPISSTNTDLAIPDPSSSKFLRWNSSGTALENSTLAGLGAIADPVPVANGGTGGTTADAARAALLVPARNVIINGNFTVWQRGTSFTSITNSNYSADRWQWVQSGAGVVDIDQLASNLPDGTVEDVLRVSVTTADTSLATTDQYSVRHHIEGFNAAQFDFGTGGAKQITLSFYVWATKSGMYTVGFKNADNNRTYVAEYTVSASNAWEKKTITLTGDMTGTWRYNHLTGINIIWNLAAGSDFLGSSGTWTATNQFSTSNQVNAMDSTSNVFQLSQVQLELGATNTPFEHENYLITLAKCQRYFNRYTGGATGSPHVMGIGFCRTTTQAVIGWPLPVPMRAAPSTTIGSDLNLNDGGGNFSITSHTNWCTSQVAAFSLDSSGMTAFRPISIGHDGAGSNTYIDFDAEL